MSAISSFVLECAQSGRWLRGLLAFQTQGALTDPSTRHARVALAQVAAPHSWAAALSLLLPLDAVHHPREVCKTIDTVARHAELPVEVFESSVEKLLMALRCTSRPARSPSRAVHSEMGPSSRTMPSSSPGEPLAAPDAAADETSIPADVSKLFLSATEWCGWESAARLLACLPFPLPRPCVERVQLLRSLRHCILDDVGPFAQWKSEGVGTGGFKLGANAPWLSSVTAPQPSLTEQLHRIGLSHGGSHSPWDLREVSLLRDRKRQQLLRDVRNDEVTLLQQARVSASPLVTSVCAALRVCTRMSSPITTTAVAAKTVPNIAWHEVKKLMSSLRLTPDVALLYGRAAGLLAPQDWAATIKRLDRAEVRDARLHDYLATWVVSRGDWEAALERVAARLHHHHRHTTDPGSVGTSERNLPDRRAITEAAMLRDFVWRTAAPPNVLFRLMPQTSRPWCRLASSRDGATTATASATELVAQALARGIRLDEMQLSQIGKQWASQGRWESALSLYYRFPLPEFQKYAVRALVLARPELLPASAHVSDPKAAQAPATAASVSSAASTATFSPLTALELLVPQDGIRYDDASLARPAPPLGTFAVSVLLTAASSWAEALAVFRASIRGGTKCQPHVLSALMDHADLPPQELHRLMRSYPTAVNDGIRRRAKEDFGVE